MAYVPGFECDILISFDDDDDRPRPGTSAGWVTTLVEHLRWRLSQWLGGSDRFVVWCAGRDVRERTIDRPDEERLRQAAILLAMHSPAYDASPRCRKELELFVGASGLANSQRDLRRVLVVDLLPRGASNATEVAAGARCYRFWGWTDRGPTTLSSPNGSEAIDYFDQLEQLARDLRFELKRMRAGGPPSPSVDDAERTIYLAETSLMSAARRDEAARYLQQAGWRVLPESVIPAATDAEAAHVAAELSRSVLFVEILGASESGTRSAGAPADRSADVAAAPGTGCRRLQWRPDGNGVCLLSGAGLEQTAVVAASFEDFKSLVVDIAQADLDRLAQPVLDSTPDARRLVCVQRHPHDQEFADDVCRRLTAVGCACSQPLLDGHPDEVRQDLEANLMDCDALIIVADACPISWVWQQLRCWRRARFLREKPVRDPVVWWRGATIGRALTDAMPQSWLMEDRTVLEESTVAAAVDRMLNADAH